MSCIVRRSKIGCPVFQSGSVAIELRDPRHDWFIAQSLTKSGYRGSTFSAMNRFPRCSRKSPKVMDDQTDLS